MSIAPISNLWPTARFFASAVLVLALGTACSAPGFVEGVVEEEGFVIRDDSPEVRTQHEGNLVVLSQEDGATLRLVKVFLPPLEGLAIGEEITLGDREAGEPSVGVAQGDLEEMFRSDGVRVLNTSNTRSQNALEGTLTLHEEQGELFGTFHAELEGGGYLDGSFVVPLD
jgi:hypothetical protein